MTLARARRWAIGLWVVMAVVVWNGLYDLRITLGVRDPPWPQTDPDSDADQSLHKPPATHHHRGLRFTHGSGFYSGILTSALRSHYDFVALD